jgi:nucleotide-binding universal stress UspA family protein
MVVRRVLVPLDGTDFAAAILPDARRLAGSDGELILIRDVTNADAGERAMLRPQQGPADIARVYLDTVAQVLRAEGGRVHTQPLVTNDAAVAIDEAAEVLHADMIAASTHGRSAGERLRSGSVAWRALVRSTVPVLLRHIDPANILVHPREANERRLMIPLDGSALAERALPLAQELADQWNASMWLVHVVSESSAEAPDREDGMDAETARAYLDEVARTLPSQVRREVLIGLTEEELVRAVGELGVTDIVLTSHGRTAVSRAIVGSVVDSLIHSVRCPVIVIPILAAMSRELDGGTRPHL